MIRAASGKCSGTHSASGMRERGVALAIVVWFIAGMSLLVAGIVSHARVDTQMAQLHVARAKAAAAGDGAIQLMMADLVTGALTQGGGGVFKWPCTTSEGSDSAATLREAAPSRSETSRIVQPHLESPEKTKTAPL